MQRRDRKRQHFWKILELRGVIAGFDPFVVVLMTDNKQQVIYKHAISTIVPERALELEAAVD